MLGYDIDTESMNIALPARKADDLCARVAEGPPGRETATVKAVSVLAGTFHHASFVIRPGRYFVRRLLLLSYLHLNEAERAGGGGRAWGRYPKQAEARMIIRIIRLSHEFMADVEWWRWFLVSGGGYGGERITAPSFSFIKQLPSRTWFSDASISGLCMETGVYWKLSSPEEV